MKEDNSEDLIIAFNPNNPTYSNVSFAFARLIHPLATVTMLSSYKESHKEYKELLYTILKWSADYEIKRDLSRIDHIILLDVYYRLQDLSGKWLFESSIGPECELSDEIVIWYWSLMILRKAQIEQK